MKLNEAGISPSQVEGLESCFDTSSNHLFSGLETKHLQMQYFKKQFNFIVRIIDTKYCCSHLFLILGTCSHITWRTSSMERQWHQTEMHL